MAEDGDLFVTGVVVAQVLAVGSEVAQAAGVHEKGGLHLVVGAVFGAELDGDAVFVDAMLGDERLLLHLGTEGFGVAQQDVVELGALDLDGLWELGERAA